MAVKFKIEKGVTPARRGPKPRIDYDGLFQVIPDMEPGDSIQILKMPESSRNSTYLTLSEAFGRRMKKEEGSGKVFMEGKRKYELKTSKIGDNLCEARVFRIA